MGTKKSDTRTMESRKRSTTRLPIAPETGMGSARLRANARASSPRRAGKVLFTAKPILILANLRTKSGVGFQGGQEDFPPQGPDEIARRADEHRGDEIPGIGAGDLGDDLRGILAAQDPPNEEPADRDANDGFPTHPQVASSPLRAAAIRSPISRTARSKPTKTARAMTE